MAEFQPDRAKLTWQLTFEGAWPTAVAVLGNSRRVAAANRAGEIYIWQLPDKSAESDAGQAGTKDDGKDQDDRLGGPPPVRQLVGHTNGVTRMVVADGGKTLITASLDHSIRMWDTEAPADGKAEVVLDAKTREKQARRNSEQDPQSEPGVEVETVTKCQVLAGHEDWVGALGISRDGRRLISGDDRCVTIVWDLAQRKELARWTGHPIDWVTSAALSPDGQTAFTAEYCSRRGDFDRPPAQARFWDAATGKEKLDVLKVMFPDVKQRDNSYGYSRTWGKFIARGLVAAEFSPDGKRLAAAQGGETGSGKVHLLETATGKLIRSVADHQYGVTDVRFSADGQYVLSTGRDTTLQISRAEDGKQAAKLHKPRGGQFKDWLYSLSISPDEKLLAATDIAGWVHVWELG